MTDQERIKWIDNASYQELLRKNRFEPSGSPWFAGPVGDHFLDVMKTKREEVGHAGHVAASKTIGWYRRQTRATHARPLD